jgi:hypothetical protein
MSSSTEQGRGTAAPLVYRDLSAIKLSFKAVQVSGGKLIGVAPTGTMIGKVWTGAERYFYIGDAGVMRLSETDLSATGGKFYMLKEAINARVGGEPAISKLFIDNDGQTLEEVLWVSGHKLHMLSFAPAMTPGPNGKAKIATHISAYSLAQDLR